MNFDRFFSGETKSKDRITDDSLLCGLYSLPLFQLLHLLL